jgi:phospholipid/cholesterol/gamma-HCH transport system substrate-binding protein
MTPRPRQRRDIGSVHGLIGVAALVVIAIAGYISYTALTGLPFQQRRTLFVEVRDANRLIATNDVRIGGVRVGQVAGVEAQPARSGGEPFARVELSLDDSVGAVPVDSTARIRPASVLGATYVDLQLGESDRKVADEGTLPGTPPARGVELTDLFDVFDREGARSFRSAVRGLSGGFAGRGGALNEFLGSVSHLLPPLTGVARTLAASDTRLDGFIRAYEQAFAEFDAASGDLGGLVSGGSRTFAALAGERHALAGTFVAAPPAELATTAALRAAQPALDDLAVVMRELRPAARALPAGVRDANATLAQGTRGLRPVPAFSGRLASVLTTLRAVSRMPSTEGAVRKLGDLITALEQTVELLAPAQIHCNVVALFGQNWSSFAGGLGVGEGPSIWNFALSTAGAQSDGYQAKEPAPDLHSNYLPHENAQECESNNEPYLPGQRLGNPPGLQPGSTRDTDPPAGVHELARRAGLLDSGSTP